MDAYQGHAHGSGVRAYQTGPDYIDVEFEDGTVYRYDYVHPGKTATEAMKTRAEAGTGLNTYINQFVRSNFAARLE